MDLGFSELSAHSSAVVRDIFLRPTHIGGHEVVEKSLDVSCQRRRHIETQLLLLRVIGPRRMGNLVSRLASARLKGSWTMSYKVFLHRDIGKTSLLYSVFHKT